jgi:hypothetical protein
LTSTLESVLEQNSTEHLNEYLIQGFDDDFNSFLRLSRSARLSTGSATGDTAKMRGRFSIADFFIVLSGAKVIR